MLKIRNEKETDYMEVRKLQERLFIIYIFQDALNII